MHELPYDVFISCSSNDKVVGNAACAALEQRGFRCWIAPRDIVPGKEWGEAIVEGIAGSRVFVLIFSASANKSPQVRREVERAVHNGATIVPFRIEDVLPVKSLEYFMSVPHWLDALTPPLERHLDHLAQVVGSLLHSNAGEAESSYQPQPRLRSAGFARLSGSISSATAPALVVTLVLLFATFRGLDPPWPAGAGYLTILPVAAGMFGLRKSIVPHSGRRRARLMFAGSIAGGSLILYLLLYSMFVESIPRTDVRLVKGFVCTSDAILVYGKGCPNLPRDALRDAEWEAMALWTSSSVTMIRTALIMAWLAFVAGLATLAIIISPHGETWRAEDDCGDRRNV